MVIHMYIQIVILLILVVALYFLAAVSIFKCGAYYKLTGNDYFDTINDAGMCSVYLIYKKLKMYEEEGGRFLFDCYLPKSEDTTTEIDAILIHSTGIFVIESRNFSGWIFGREGDETWTQSHPRGRRKVKKMHFCNPVKQSNAHVEWLKRIVGDQIPVYSIIVFSNRCTLLDIEVENPKIKVVNRRYLRGTVKRMGSNSQQGIVRMDIDRIYEKLYPYTQVSKQEKMMHFLDVYDLKHGFVEQDTE